MHPDTLVADGTISRRRLLVGAAVLAGATALGRGTFGGTPGPLARLAAAEGPRLSVGFLPGLFGPESLPAGERAVPATRLRRSAELPAGTPAHVRVRGLTPGSSDQEGRVRGIDLDALMAPPDRGAAEPLSFYAWTMRTGSHGGRSNATGFVAGLDEDPGLGFALSVHRAGQDGLDTQRASVVLSAAGRNGTAVLRPGTYLLGVDPGRWDAPTTVPAAGDEAAWRRLRSLVVTVQPAGR